MSIWRKNEINKENKDICKKDILYLDYDYITQDLVNRFWSNVDKKGIDECWEWKNAISYGCGVIAYNGKFLKVHRLSYIIAYGNIPKGLVVRHKCDNYLCVNPNHLVTLRKRGSDWNKGKILRKEWLKESGYDSLKEYVNESMKKIKK